MRMYSLRSVIGAGWLTLTLAASVSAQGSPAAQTTTIRVSGKQMRYIAAGVEQRKAAQPVVVLEAGAVDPTKSTLDEWTKALPAISRIAPVVAYERRGYGLSEADTERPTMRRIATVLHELLTEAHIGPPYVLVGHSWGGNYIRAFTDLYPAEVVGLVFVDADNGMGPWREERAAVLPPDQRAEALKPPVLPPIPPNTPLGIRAQFEEIGKEMVDDGKEVRTFKPVTGIPVGIIIATPPGRLQGNARPVVRLQIDRALDLALSAPNGMLVTANHVRHAVQDDDPGLVATVIKHIVDSAGISNQR
jgi:pimeloyl-ACP methyl ester carboxylesterase